MTFDAPAGSDWHESRNSEDHVAADRLLAFVERVERLEAEIKELNTDKAEVYAEAKGNGFDVKAMKRVVALRRQDKSERQEHEAIVGLYLDALGEG